MSKNRSTQNHNRTDAGWVVSDEAGSAPKTVHGDREPPVTTEKFGRGLATPEKRSPHQYARRKHDYRLKGLICIALRGRSYRGLPALSTAMDGRWQCCLHPKATSITASPAAPFFPVKRRISRWRKCDYQPCFRCHLRHGSVPRSS